MDGLLEAAMTTNDCVEAVVAAMAAEERALRDLREGQVAGERGHGAGVREASASFRYGVAIVGYEDLVRQWAQQALHLARTAAGALRSVQADPAAVVAAAQVGFGDIMAVSRLYADLRLLPSPVGTDGGDATELRAAHGSATSGPATQAHGDRDDDPASELRAAYGRVVRAVAMGVEHNCGDVRIVDAVVDPDAKRSVFDAYLREVAGALHDYGASALWRVAVMTGRRYGE